MCESRTARSCNFFRKRCGHPSANIRENIPDTRRTKIKQNRIPYFKIIIVMYCIVFHNNYASVKIILFSFETHNLLEGLMLKRPKN